MKIASIPIMEYEVSIDEETTFQEIIQHYDIIEHRGDIWVLRDKVDEGD